MPEDPPSPQPPKPEKSKVAKGQPGTLRVLLALAGPAVLAIGIYSAAEHSWSVFAVSMVSAICAFALGGLLGFLFGIPQYLAKSEAASDHRDKAGYQPNTNLTQVSDWLTKIIIGVGLVQFNQLAHSIGKLGDSLAPSVGGDPSGKPYSIAVVVGFFIIGFLVGYLYTRLRLQWAFAEADRGAFAELIEEKLEEQSKVDAQAVKLGSQQLDPMAAEPPPEKLKEAMDKASPAVQAQILSDARKVEKPGGTAPPPERARKIIEAIDEDSPPSKEDG